MNIHSLPERLRLLRQEKKMTQEGIAKAILVPRVTYTHYELGKRTPDLDTIFRLADFHHVSIDFLLGKTWLRPSLENWLSENVDTPIQGFSGTYARPEASRGEKIADSPDPQ